MLPCKHRKLRIRATALNYKSILTKIEFKSSKHKKPNPKYVHMEEKISRGHNLNAKVPATMKIKGKDSKRNRRQ